MNNQKGFVTSLLAIIVLAFMLSLAMSISTVILIRHRISENEVKLSQSYYAAESGIEDSLWRLKKNPQMGESEYDINLGVVKAHVKIPELVAGSRTVTSDGNFYERKKKARAVFASDAEGISFYYGVQVGEGGLEMSNGSRVEGNVFSDGNVTGSGTIENDLIVAGSCIGVTIEDNLTYELGGTNTCSVTGQTTQTEVASQPLSISQAQIDSLESAATNGGLINNDYIVDGEDVPLGPKTIAGSLTVTNNSVLRLTGVVYVTGNIIIGNNSVIRLDNSYGQLSGFILAEGVIDVSNNSMFAGSGQAGSYVVVISTSPSASAISVKNNAVSAVFYASNGTIILSNGVHVKEATAYKLKLNNNAIVEYETGLANASFSSGPSGGWRVTSWEETE